MKVGTTLSLLGLADHRSYMAARFPFGPSKRPGITHPPDKSPPLTQDLKQDLTQVPTQVLKAPIFVESNSGWAAVVLGSARFSELRVLELIFTPVIG